MELIKEITEDDIDINEPTRGEVELKPRNSARAVVFNEEADVALIRVAREKYYKLPGGGMNSVEKPEDALKREIKEETGYDIEILKELGKIVENRLQTKKQNISFTYMSVTKGQPEKVKLTKGEKYLGFELVWKNIDEAVNLLQQSNPKEYSPKFIVVRDLLILEKARDLLRSYSKEDEEE